jgi:Mg2+ and Co2+ transporter CorA
VTRGGPFFVGRVLMPPMLVASIYGMNFKLEWPHGIS